MGSKNILLQCLLGIQCKDFVMIAADQIDAEGIIIIKNDDDKIFHVSDKIIMGMNGDIADRTQFSEIVSKNMELYKKKNGYQLSTTAVIHYTRKIMIEVLQNGCPFIVNLLMAGFDGVEGAQLYTLDVMGSSVKVPFAAHGAGGLLTYSIISTYYRPDLTEEQAYEVIKLCVCEIRKRLLMNLCNFSVKTVSKDGIKILPVISPSVGG